MKAIVTGATGFIGQHLVTALEKQGWEVVCLDRRTVAESRPAVRRVVADFQRDDLGISTDVFAEADVLFHLAGATRAVSRAAFDDANVKITERLCGRASGRPGGRAAERPGSRFIYVSSQAASGPAMDAQSPKTELDPAAPIEDYGRSKLAAERLVAAATDLRSTVLRPVAVLGPGDRDFLSIFQMATRGLAIYPGIRKSMINWIYVDDLVDAIIAAAESPATVGKTYFLGSPDAASWKEIYGMVGEIVGHPSLTEIEIPKSLVGVAAAVGDLASTFLGKPLLLNSSKAKLGAPKYWLCSSARAKADFNFSPQTNLRDALQATYEWYRSHRWL
jgi:nucleoside-diphosphate-sugar epimerase